jgi:hypothetical protein
MEDLLESIALICMGAMFLALVFLCFWMYPSMTDAKKMDCSLVEFSPDISTEIKQLCREARKTK